MCFSAKKSFTALSARSTNLFSSGPVPPSKRSRSLSKPLNQSDNWISALFDGASFHRLSITSAARCVASYALEGKNWR